MQEAIQDNVTLSTPGDERKTINSEDSLKKLIDFFESLPAIDGKGSNLDRFIGGIIFKSQPKFYTSVESGNWGDVEDLRQTAATGIFKAWQEISNKDTNYTNFYDSFNERVKDDPLLMSGWTDEAKQRHLTPEDIIREKAAIIYMRRAAMRELNSFIYTNAGSLGSRKRALIGSGKLFSEIPEGYGDENDLDYIEKILHKNQETPVEESISGFRALYYKNAPARAVVQAVSSLLDMDQNLNFPERDYEKDVPRIQSMFLESVIEVISKERGYTGIGPKGKPRYRQMDPVTLELEKEVINALMFEGSHSISLSYVKQLLKEKPIDWDHSFKRRGKYGGGDKNPDSYPEIRYRVKKLLLEKERSYASYYPRTNYKDSWFDKDGNLVVDFIPENLINEVMDISPDIVKGIDLRKKAWGRVLSLMRERQKEIVAVFKDKVEHYLIDEKGEKRIW